ncbi:unnamed protein product [Cuscuta europaea]|uniref:Uncharacterized protein n=1 Tax=Cuscuta europaea TaxID=41803 RepID=A0A9P1EG92_CUSEU|nr:unnamed protein product [Cuscuta europaea]
MALLTSLSLTRTATPTSLSTSTRIFYDHVNLRSSSSSFSGSRQLPLSGMPFFGHFQKQFVVYAKRLSGLEEALRMKRERELKGSNSTQRRVPLKRGRVSPELLVPDHIVKPPYVGSRELPEIANEHQIHDAEGISRMRAAGELAARVLEYAGTLVRVRFIDTHCLIRELLSQNVYYRNVKLESNTSNVDVLFAQ